MSRLFAFVFALLVAVSVVLPGTGASARERSQSKTPQAVSDSDRKKAEYLFMEAASAFNRGDYEQSYLLLRQAAALSPADPYISGKLAEIEIILPTADTAVVQKAYEAVKARFYADPSDEPNANMAANLASNLRDFDELISIWQTVDSVSPKRSDAALNLADALLERFAQKTDSADCRRAFAVLDRLEAKAGPVSPIAMRKISAFSMLKDTASALAETQKYVAAAPADPSAMMNAALFYEHLGHADSARVFYDRAATLDPDNGAIHVARANFFNRQNDSIAFDGEVVRALESPMLVFEQKMPLLAGYVKGLYADSLNWERIDRMFGIMQEVNAGEPELHDYYAYFKHFKHDVRGAAEQLAYAVDLDPANIDRRLQLISTLIEIPDTVEALKVARQAHADFPSNVPVALYLASNEAFNGRGDKALAILDALPLDSITDTAELGRIFATKGDILSRTDMKAATDAYIKALNYDPENYMTMNNLAYHWAESDTLLDKAAIYAEMAVAAEPSNPTYLDTYAWVFFKQKKYAEAREQIDKALELYSADEVNGGAEGGDNSEERREVYPPSAEIYDHAGDIYFMNGEFDSAVQFWKDALELDKDNKKIQKKIKQRAYTPD